MMVCLHFFNKNIDNDMGIIMNIFNVDIENMLLDQNGMFIFL